MSDILKGSGNEGDFVLNNQELATDDGFRNVSKLWYDKTMSYEQGLAHLDEEVDEREDIVCKPKDMVPTFDEESGDVYFEYDRPIVTGKPSSVANS